MNFRFRNRPKRREEIEIAAFVGLAVLANDENPVGFLMEIVEEIITAG